MKKITLTLIFISLSMLSFAQQRSFNGDSRALYSYKIDHYHRMKTTGQVLTFGGSALVIIGIATLANSIDKYDNSNTTSSGLPDGFLTGFLVTYGGAACVTAGVPLWIVGGISKGKYERKLDSLSFKIKVNQQSAGLAFCYRF